MSNKKKSNIWAILGFIFSFFSSIVGFILSIIGIAKTDTLKTGKGLSIAGIVISILTFFPRIILLCFLAYLLVFEGNFNYSTKIVKVKENLISKGYVEVDLDYKEDLSPLINDINDLNTDLNKLNQICIKNQKFKLNNNIFKFTDINKNIEQTIENVRYVKYYINDEKSCIVNVYVITKDNHLWYYDSSKSIQEEAFIEFDKLIKDVKVIDSYSSILLFESLDGKYYEAETLEEFDETTAIYNGIQVLTNGDVYYNNFNQYIEYKFGIYSDISDELEYFISNNNYLYDLNATKVSYKKVNSIFKLENSLNYEPSIVIIYKDGTSKELNYYNYLK